jgi:threonyl-tRNA synthetase
MLVVGERESAAGTVSLRHRTGDELKDVPLERLVADLATEIARRAPDLTVGRS